MPEININRKDVVWNYAATFLQIGVGIILLPFILRVFPQETVGIWTIFTTVIALSSLLDFGFNPSFTRNVTYVVSGVKNLQARGFQVVETNDSEIDYGLFKGLINAMRWFYSRMSLLLLVLLASAGTYYISVVLKTYTYDHTEVYVAWAMLIVINAYSLYTMYYDSLMQGKGLVKRAKQIQILGQSVYLIVAVVLILLHFSLVAIVSAQALSILIRRVLSYKVIYTKDFSQRLKTAVARGKREMLRAIYPNAVKVGIRGLGDIFISRSPVIIGALYLSLDDIASYGITRQIFELILTASTLYNATYIPKFANLWAQRDKKNIRAIYRKGIVISLLIVLMGTTLLMVSGDYFLHLIKSQTMLLPVACMIVLTLHTLFTSVQAQSAAVINAANHIPLYLASIIGGALVVLLLLIFFNYTALGVMGMVLAPTLVYLAFENWVWPLKAIKLLKNNSS